MRLNGFNTIIMAYTDFTEYYKYLESSNINIFNVKDHLVFRSRAFMIDNE
jgi:hypothetical protein